MKMIKIRLITYPIAYIMWGGLMWYSQIITPFDFTNYLHYIPLCNAKFYHILQTSPYWIVEFFRIVYMYLFTICVVGGIGYYLIIKKNYLKADIILIDIALGWLIAGLIYTFFIVQSPFQVGVAQDLVNTPYLWIFTKPTYEIPSLHTAYSVLMALHFKDEKSKIRYLFYALGILIPISTLFMGQHWIVDVITGVIFAYILYRLPKNIHLKIHNALNYLSGHYGVCARICEKNTTTEIKANHLDSPTGINSEGIGYRSDFQLAYKVGEQQKPKT